MSSGRGANSPRAHLRRAAWTLLAAVVLLGVLLSSACEPTNVNCPDVGKASIVIAVTDSVSGAYVPGATAWVVDGTFVDTLEASFEGASWVESRVGTYDVHVTHESYRPWLKTGVQLYQKDRCFTNQVQLTARLRPQ